MASDPNNPSIQDIINAAGSPLQAQAPTPPTLLSTATPSPALAPSGAEYAQSVAPKPTLGTNAELQAPAANASTSQAANDQTFGPSSVTLPARTADNSAGPAEPQPPTMLHKIGSIAAELAGAPQLADPNASPASKAQGIMNILRTIGNVGANATGSPEQKQQAIAREQQQIEQSKIPLQLAQLRNEQQYRQGMLANTANKNASYAQNIDINRQKANGAMQAKGYLPDEQNPGAFRPMTPGEILQDPILSQSQEVKSAAVAAQHAMTALNQAKQAGITNPDSLTQRNIEAKLAEQERVALAQLEVAKSRNASFLLRTQTPVTDAEGNTHGYFNPQTNTYTPISGNPAAAAAAGGEGGTIPPKPTSSMLTMGQMAQTIQQQVPQLKQEIADLGDKVGAAPGRWNDFWVKKVGKDDPAYAGVDQDLQLYATALGKAHFGASMPEGFVKDMMKDFSLAQSPADLQSRVDHAEGWVNGYAARVGGSAGKSAAKPLTSTTAGSGAGLTPAQYLAQKNKVAGAK